MRIPQHHEAIYRLIGDDILTIPTHGTGAFARIDINGVSIGVKLLYSMIEKGTLVQHDYNVHTGVYRYHVSEAIREFLRTAREPKPTPRKRKARQ